MEEAGVHDLYCSQPPGGQWYVLASLSSIFSHSHYLKETNLIHLSFNFSLTTKCFWLSCHEHIGSPWVDIIKLKEREGAVHAEKSVSAEMVARETKEDKEVETKWKARKRRRVRVWRRYQGETRSTGTNRENVGHERHGGATETWRSGLKTTRSFPEFFLFFSSFLPLLLLFSLWWSGAQIDVFCLNCSPSSTCPTCLRSELRLLSCSHKASGSVTLPQNTPWSSHLHCLPFAC